MLSASMKKVKKEYLKAKKERIKQLQLRMNAIRKDKFTSHGQVLPSMARIERFLADLKECGGHFRLVFFNCLKDWFMKKSPQMWMLRNCFLTHCQHGNVDIHVFDCTWFDKEWASYLSSWKPSFVLMDCSIW
jgi:hypothetical protein